VGQKCRKNAHNSKLESHNFTDKRVSWKRR